MGSSLFYVKSSINLSTYFLAIRTYIIIRETLRFFFASCRDGSIAPITKQNGGVEPKLQYDYKSANR